MFSLIADDEIFVDIQGYEKMYSISNYGRIYSNKGKGRFLKQFTDSGGYLQVDLFKDGKGKQISVHTIVGNAFIGKRENGLTFDHIDRNRQNNKANNIRLATQSEQVINQKIRNSNKTGEKNIHIWIDKRNRNVFYRIQIKRKRKIVLNRLLNTNEFCLADAIKIRDDFLKN